MDTYNDTPATLLQPHTCWPFLTICWPRLGKNCGLRRGPFGSGLRSASTFDRLGRLDEGSDLGVVLLPRGGLDATRHIHGIRARALHSLGHVLRG